MVSHEYWNPAISEGTCPDPAFVGSPRGLGSEPSRGHEAQCTWSRGAKSSKTALPDLYHSDCPEPPEQANLTGKMRRSEAKVTRRFVCNRKSQTSSSGGKKSVILQNMRGFHGNQHFSREYIVRSRKAAVSMSSQRLPSGVVRSMPSGSTRSCVTTCLPERSRSK